MRRGIRLGVDVGSVRIGVARCDPEGLLATPVATVAAGDGAIDDLAAIVAEEGAIEVIVGLPLSLSGAEGPAAAKAREFAAGLAARVPVPVRLVDERMSTVEATRSLRASGVNSRKGRSVVDQASAVVILHHALESERASGRPPGRAVEEGGAE
jgi:putative Holliday junction resolvase